MYGQNAGRVYLDKTDTTLCAVDIPPENWGDESETEKMFAYFGDEVHQALTDLPHLVVCGDFIARTGIFKEISDTHLDVLTVHPQLVDRSVTQCTPKNSAGRFLVDITSNLDCISVYPWGHWTANICGIYPIIPIPSYI